MQAAKSKKEKTLEGKNKYNRAQIIKAERERLKKVKPKDWSKIAKDSKKKKELLSLKNDEKNINNKINNLKNKLESEKKKLTCLKKLLNKNSGIVEEKRQKADAYLSAKIAKLQSKKERIEKEKLEKELGAKDSKNIIDNIREYYKAQDLETVFRNKIFKKGIKINKKRLNYLNVGILATEDVVDDIFVKKVQKVFFGNLRKVKEQQENMIKEQGAKQGREDALKERCRSCSFPGHISFAKDKKLFQKCYVDA